MGEPFLHFDKFDDFNSKKLSANEENTKYTIGVDGAVTSGSPDILWHSICWIKDARKMWTHGRLYDCSSIEEALALLESTKSKAGAYVTVGVTTKGGNVDSVTLDETKLSNAIDSKASTSYVDRGLSTKAETSAIPTKVSQLDNDSGYIKSLSKGNVADIYTAQKLMCDIEINGNTITPKKFSGSVGNPLLPVYIGDGKPTTITSFPEAYLSWGGKNYASSYGPIDAALVDVLRANRFDGLPAECITVEYSRDGGATWLDYGATDKQKVDMVSQTPDRANLDIGKNDTDNPVNANHKLRVIINTFTQGGTNKLYTELRKFIIYVNNASNFQTTCTIKKRAQPDYAAGNDVWSVVSENIPIAGWSGYNVINTSTINTYGNQSHQSRELMFEFSIGNPPSSGRGFSILKIFAYGGVGYDTPSNMAARGHLYSYDYQQNANFPSKVNAVGGFQEDGTNLSSKYLGINAAAKSISDGTNSYTPSAIKTMETNLEDVISDVVSIDTSLFPTSTDEVIGFRQTNGGDGVGYSEAWLDRLKGNTVVWNQYVKTLNSTNYRIYSSTVGSINFTDNSAKITVLSNITNVYVCSLYSNYKIDVIANHKYATFVTAKADKSGRLFHSLDNKYVNINTQWTTVSFIVNRSSSVTEKIYIGVSTDFPVGSVIELKDFQVVDLTQMFGAGNEPTTIEEFNARKPLGVSDDYNEGELISTTSDELKSVGFNAWDEEWENGLLDSKGENLSSTTAIRSVNHIPVLPNTTYFFDSPSVTGNGVAFYDENKVIIPANAQVGKVLLPLSPNSEFTTPANCRYIRFDISSGYGGVYNHDICIHLVHTGTRNGQYEPYKEYRLHLPIKDIKDKDGNQLFPNGLLSAGSVYDEITATKAIKRIGVVDMGTLSWNYNPSTLRFYCNFNKHNKGLANVVCPKYPTDNISVAEKDKMITSSNNYEAIYVKDSSYTSAATFKAAMSGVMLYYELAEPIEVDIEEWDRRYEVSDFGTEEVISDTPTTPLKADIIYEYNAKGRIEANERGIEELNDKLAEMNEYSITSDKVWSEDTPVDCTIGEVDNDAFLPDGLASVGGKSRISRMYVKFSTADNSYSGEMVSEYADNCLIIGVKGYYELTAPNGTMLKRDYLGDSNVKVEQTGNIGYRLNFTALDMEEGMNVRGGAIIEYIDID